MLGDTLEKIASEKAGIIKKNVPVVIGEITEIKSVFENKATEMNSSIVFADEQWQTKSVFQTENALHLTFFNAEKEFEIENQLSGFYQIKNSKTVLSCCEILKDNGWNISHEDILKGFKNVKTNTGLRGRWDILQNQPTVVADIAHNEAGIAAVLEQISKTKFNQLHIVLGMVKDKDINKVLSLLPTSAKYYFCQPDLPRALSVDNLHASALLLKLIGEKYSSVQLALNAAKSNASADDLILITGSNFVVAEVI